jgi:hypothetical protein
MRAVRWEPLELSLVAVPADVGAAVRQNPEQQGYRCEVRRLPMGTAERRSRAQGDDDKEKDDEKSLEELEEEGGKKKVEDVLDENEDDEGEGAREKDKPPERASPRMLVRAERARIREIMKAGRIGHLADDVVERYIEQGTAVEAVRAAALDHLDKQTKPIGGAITVGETGSSRFYRGLVNVLLNRLRPDKWKIDEDGKPLVGLRVFELARRSLEVSGIRTEGMDQLTLAGYALGSVKPERVRGDGFLTTSDFPAAMLSLARATLAEGYLGAPRTFPEWTRRTTVPDFRPMYRVALGAGPKLLPVPQHAEFQRGRGDVHAELQQLATWGRIVPLTRQAIINDDLSAFNRIPIQFGYAAAQLEGDVVYQVLTGNPPMSDGNQLFSAAHNNIAPAAFINLQSMTVARKMMQVQQSSDGQFLGITPMFLIVGPNLETEALQFTSSTIVPRDPTGVIPPYFKALIVKVDPRIQDNSWFLACSPNQLDTIEYAYLEGAPEGGPMIEQKEGWDIDGIEYKCRHDFAAAAIEWRGLVWTQPAAGTPTSSVFDYEPAPSAQETTGKRR